MLTKAEIVPYIEQGMVTARRHPTLPLTVYNYSKVAPYTYRAPSEWPEVVRQCRGLVLDDDDNIVSRCIPKFFNLFEHTAPLPDLPFVVQDKIDGSLITVSSYHGQTIVSSRGSFESDHAYEALKIINDVHWYPEPELTYVFELTHPDLRIVIDYGDTPNLTLLTTIVKDDSSEWLLDGVVTPFDRPITFYVDDINTLPEREDAEGYVVIYLEDNQPSLRVKIKHPRYVELHRLIFGLTERKVLEMVRDLSWDDFKVDIPEEFRGWADELVVKINNEHARMLSKAHNTFQISPKFSDRKTFAHWATKTDIPDLLFAMLDQNDEKLAHGIWKRVEERCISTQ